MNVLFYVKAEKAENFSDLYIIISKSCRQIFDVCHCSQVIFSWSYEISWFNKNNSSAIKIWKYATKMNYTGLISPQTKLQTPPMKGERKHSFLVSSYGIVKYEALAVEYFKYSDSHSLETLIFSGWSWRKLSKNVHGGLRKYPNPTTKNDLLIDSNTWDTPKSTLGYL